MGSTSTGVHPFVLLTSDYSYSIQVEYLVPSLFDKSWEFYIEKEGNIQMDNELHNGPLRYYQKVSPEVHIVVMWPILEKRHIWRENKKISALFWNQFIR